MYAQQTKLINKSGLHARPASDFVKLAKSFQSSITVRDVGGGRPAVNAKSIVRILSEGLCLDTQIEISADGADEREAVEQLAALIDSGFGEE